MWGTSKKKQKGKRGGGRKREYGVRRAYDEGNFEKDWLEQTG
jgi:hypothetical protein